jgi:hypothetical protein
MNKSFVAPAIFSLLGAVVVALPALHRKQKPAKRLPIRSVARDCAQQF